MPTVSLSVLNVISSTIPSAGAAARNKDGFQSLLNIGAPPEGETSGRETPSRTSSRETPAASAADRPEQRPIPHRDPSKRKPPSAAYNGDPVPIDRRILRGRPTATSSGNAVPIDRPIMNRDEHGRMILPRPAGEGGQAQETAAEAVAAADPEALFQANVFTNGMEFLLPSAPSADHAAVPNAVFATAPSITEMLSAPAGRTAEAFVPAADAIPLPEAVSDAGRSPKAIHLLLQNIHAMLDKVVAMFSGIHPLTPPPADGGNPLIQKLWGSVKAIRAIFESYEAGKIDGMTAAQAIKPVLTDLHRILARLGMDGPFRPAVDVPGLPRPAVADATDGAAAPKAAARVFSADRAEAATPLNTGGTTQQAAATFAAAAGSGGDAGSHSGNHAHTGQGQPPPVMVVRPAVADAQIRNPAAADFARTLTQAARMPVAEQVVFHIRTALADGSSRIRIQLEPAELGKLDIKMHVDAAGKTGVTITADNKHTLDLLQRDARGLERALNDAGLTADSGSMNFNLKGGGHQEREAFQAAGIYRNIMPEEETKPVDALTRSYVVNLAEGLDIKI